MKIQSTERTSERTDAATGATITTTRRDTVRVSKNGRVLTFTTTKRTVTKPAPAAQPERPADDDLNTATAQSA